MSQKDCIAKFLGKINHNELLDTAAEFEARGQSANDAMLSAVQDKIDELEMEQSKVVKAVRDAFVKDGGKESPKKVDSTKAPETAVFSRGESEPVEKSNDTVSGQVERSADESTPDARKSDGGYVAQQTHKTTTPDSGGAFSRNPFGTPTTVTALQSAIKELTGMDGANQMGRIVATTAAEIKSTWEPLLGKSVNIESEGDAGAAQGFFDPKSKTIFLIADHIREGAETAVLAHELMHKWGQQVLGKDGWDRLHGVISSWEKADHESDEWVVYNYARNKVEAVGAELSNQELFPYAVEAALKMGIKPDMQAGRGTVARWLESVRQSLKMVWAKITGKPETFKAQDMVNLAFGIAQMENPEYSSIKDSLNGGIPDVSDNELGPAIALLDAGKSKDLYRLPISDANDLETMAKDKGMTAVNSKDANAENADFAKGIEVDDSSDPMGAEGRRNLARIMSARHEEKSTSGNFRTWDVETDAGAKGVLTQDGDRVWINVAGDNSGKGGSSIYDLAANYAKNNQLTFIGDPDGLTDAGGMRRRLENMLNAAVKYQSTDFLMPHEKQRIGNKELGIPALKWTKGDTLSNIRSMMDASVASNEHGQPFSTGNTNYDPATQSFHDGFDRHLDDDALSGLLGFDSRETGDGKGGVTTLKRTAFIASLLRGADERRTILEKLHDKQAAGSLRPSGESAESWYSRDSIVGQTNRQHTPEQLRAMKNVGFQVEVPTLKERAQAIWKDAGKKMAQGIVDQFAPVKDLDKHAYGLLRLAKGATGAFEAFLQGGKLKLTDGVYDFDDTNKGGVVDRLLMPLQGEHHDFFRWVAANRAERLQSEGKENLFTPQDIADLKTLADGTTDFDYTIQTGPGAGRVTRDRTLIYADANRVFNEFNRNVLDMAEQSGLIDGASRKVWEHEFYVPFYRVADDSDGGVRGMNIKGGAVRQQAFKQLKGGKNALNADLMDNTLMNWAHLLDAAAKNRAAKATIEAAERMGVATTGDQATLAQMGSSINDKNGVVWFMDGGQKRFSLVDDPFLMTAITSLEYAGMRNPVMNAMGAMKHALTVGVTASPFFKVRNLIRDSVQAIGTGELSYNPAKNLSEGWKLTDPKSDAYFRLLAGGGTIHFGTMMEGSESKRVQALVESGVNDSTILNNEHKVKAFYRKFIEPGVTAYNELGNRGEAINRAALYDQLRKQGMNHADASLQARDLMDFSMQGSFTTIRFLTQVVPFFNARIQGLYKLGKSARENPARFSAVLGAAAMMSIGLLAAYGDDDDWKKREEWDRNNFWWFKFGGTAFRIPKPFEIGAIATLAERGFELAFDKEMTNKRFMNQVVTLLGDNLSMNPVPQMVKPILDVYANKDSFSGRPIETMGMEKLKSEYRFTDRTSMAARGASTAMNAVTGLVGAEGLSPVQIDSMLRGYFGWLGSFVIGAGDVIARPATGQTEHASSDIWKAATGGMVSNLQDAPSRYVSQMYTQAKEIEQAYGTWRSLLKEGKTAEAQEFAADNRDSLMKYRNIESVKRAEAKFNERIRMIERSNMDPDAKRDLIRSVQQQKNRVAQLAA